MIFAGATHAIAQERSPSIAQVVALGRMRSRSRSTRRRRQARVPSFAETSRLDLVPRYPTYFTLAEAGTPDPGWDFEPDKLVIKKGTILSVVDQGA